MKSRKVWIISKIRLVSLLGLSPSFIVMLSLYTSRLYILVSNHWWLDLKAKYMYFLTICLNLSAPICSIVNKLFIQHCFRVKTLWFSLIPRPIKIFNRRRWLKELHILIFLQQFRLFPFPFVIRRGIRKFFIPKVCFAVSNTSSLNVLIDQGATYFYTWVVVQIYLQHPEIFHSSHTFCWFS